MIVTLPETFVLLSTCYSCVVRAEGEPAKVMTGQLTGNLLNIIPDPLMTITFGWNITGAAVATVTGNVAQFAGRVCSSRRSSIRRAFSSASMTCLPMYCSRWGRGRIASCEHVPPGASVHFRTLHSRILLRSGRHNARPAGSRVLSLILTTVMYAVSSKKLFRS